MKRLSCSEGTKMDALSLVSIRIERGRACLVVRVCSDKRFTDRLIVERALRVYPDLAHHACVNAKGPTFASDILGTSLPHLLEHLIIDIQLADERTAPDARFVGNTTWIDEVGETAQINVTFADDLVVLRAIGQAVTFVNECCV